VQRPVFGIPPAVDPPTATSIPEGLLPAGNGPLALCSFDFDSVVERKNPIAAIVAFRKAVPAGAGPRLLVKSLNGHLHPEQASAVATAADGRRDILFVDRYLDRHEQSALIAACDLFVSLHRAEGFGLMLAEAMFFSRAVVATAYSGNLDFMDASNSILVPWQYVEIPRGAGPYTGRWAEPDTDAASAAIGRLLHNPDLRAELGDRARRSIRERHGIEARGRQIAAHLRSLSDPGVSSSESDFELARLGKRIETGPDADGRSALGGLGRLARRLLLRAGRHAWLHQRAVDSGLLRELQRERSARLVLERDLRAALAAERARCAREFRRAQRRLETPASRGLAILADETR
jgi:hypothetical protein